LKLNARNVKTRSNRPKWENGRRCKRKASPWRKTKPPHKIPESDNSSFTERKSTSWKKKTLKCKSNYRIEKKWDIVRHRRGAASALIDLLKKKAGTHIFQARSVGNLMVPPKEERPKIDEKQENRVRC